MKREWFAGVDWGSEKHAVCLIDTQGKVVGEKVFDQACGQFGVSLWVFEHTGDGITAMADWLVKESAGEASSIAVAIEMPRGAVVETLLVR